MSEYDKLKTEFENSVRELRARCPHSDTFVKKFRHYKGNSSTYFKVCQNCGMVLHHDVLIKQTLWYKP